MTNKGGKVYQHKSPLPPNKRAKTKEEKQQRNIERILRNRRAAHTSREKRRINVEHLELYAEELENSLLILQDNFDIVWNQLKDTQRIDLNLPSLNNLSCLRERFYPKLNKTPLFKSYVFEANNQAVGTPYEKSESKENSIIINPEQSSIPECEEINSCNWSNDGLLLSETFPENEISYFEYLSPISINSPIDSSSDLKLKMSDYNAVPITICEDELFSSPNYDDISTHNYDLI